MRPIRALCLHGWRTNAALMKFQTSQLQRAFTDRELSLVHVDGPHLVSAPADPSLANLVPAPYFEWWNAHEEGGSGDNGGLPHGFSTDASVVRYEGLAESIAFINEVIHTQGPFDVLVGFSQGGILATILTASHERPHDFPMLRKIGRDSLSDRASDDTRTAPWSCVLLVGAMLPRDTSLPSWLNTAIPTAVTAQHVISNEGSTVENTQANAGGGPVSTPVRYGLTTPSVHVYGLEDSMLPLSRALATWWRGAERAEAISSSSETTSEARVGDVSKESSTCMEEEALFSRGAERVQSQRNESVVEVVHNGGHRFPGGRDAKTSYDAIKDAVTRFCRPPEASSL